MSAKLAAGIICYNDAPGLKRLLDSIHEHVDYAFVIDGKYPDWGKSTDHPYSTDGTQFFANSYENVRYYSAAAHQEVKRSKYLEAAGQYDCEFLLVLDCDEYVTKDSNWDILRTKLRDRNMFEDHAKRVYQFTWNIPYIYEPNKKGSLPRLIYRPYLFRYTSHYFMVHRKDGWQVSMSWANNPRETLEGITICNDDNLRSKDRMHHDIEYQWYLFYKEGAIDELVYHDKEAKKKFADHIAYEYDVWKTKVEVSSRK